LTLTFRALTLATFALAASALHAQAIPTATEALRLSAFAGGTGDFTGLKSGRNASFTAGVDLGIRSFFGIAPSVEIRGTYPVDTGGIDSQKYIAGGVKLEKRYYRFHPYVDFLFGRGQIDYHSGGYPSLDGRFVYIETPSNVISPGVGLDFDLGHHFAAKADAQLQYWKTPVTASGHIYAKPITIGLQYRFDFNRKLRVAP
jgi:hypothetical protein